MSTYKTILLCAAATLFVSPSMAQDEGKILFEREWEFEAKTDKIPKSALPKRLTQEERVRLREIASELGGDGLGPMHNATSCEACHAKGGAAGVDRNVTTLTLDPRSPLLKTISSDRSSLNRVPEDVAKHARTELNALFPGLVSTQGSPNLDIVVHEFSALDPDGYQDLRDGLFAAVPNVDQRWADRKQRTSELIASEPVLAGRKNEIDFYLSQRNPPPLFGLGVIDRISQSRLEKIAEAQAKKSRGTITGRPSTGKFGWRGQASSLDSFVRGACAGELGLQVSDIAQAQDPVNVSYVSLGSDLNDDQVKHLTSYIRGLPAPRVHGFRANQKTIREGKKLFASVGCAACHVQDLTPARGIYSDLLLHDMGPALQAPSPAPSATWGVTIGNIGERNGSARAFGRRQRGSGTPEPDYLFISSWMRSEVVAYYGAFSSSATRIPNAYGFIRPGAPQFPYGEASDDELRKGTRATVGAEPWDILQREWRTPPLWGVADSAPYLHDGRAKTLEEAIHWHGGEARESVTAFKRRPAADQEKLLRFLLTLRAPTAPDKIAKKQPPSKELPEVVAAAMKSATSEPSADSGALDSVLDVFSSGY